MRKGVVLLILTLLTTVGIAQNTRIVKGFVKSEDGKPVVGATIKAVDEDVTTTSTLGGAFEIRVSPYCKFVEARLEGCLTAVAEIDGSTIIFTMKVDKKYAKSQEQARIAAEKEAAAKAEAEEEARIAAEKEAAAKAEAERRAQELALINPQKAAAVKAKAEEQARIAAEKAEKARLAEIKAEKRRKLYAEKQSGFASIADVSYMVGIGGINPSIGINYIAGYRINNLLYVGGGTGVNINLGAGPSVRGIAKPYSGTNVLNPCLVSVPVFAYFRANFLNRRCSPFFALAAGGDFSGKQTLHLDLCDVKYNTTGIFFNPQLGVNFRTSTKTSLYLATGFNGFTTPSCPTYTAFGATTETKFAYAIDIHLGVTF